MSKEISRREFLKVAGIGGAGITIAVLDKCGVFKKMLPAPIEGPPVVETVGPPKRIEVVVTRKAVEGKLPTEAPTKKPPTPEPTKEKITYVSGVAITKELLKKTFAGIGGGETLANGRGEETTLISFGKDYVSQSWEEEVNFTTLSQDPLASLKYLVSLGAYQGKEGVYSPGKQEEEIIFPQLKDLSLARLTLDKVPSLAEQQSYDYQEWISPRNFLLHPETQMTVVGFFTPTPPEGAVVIDQPTPEAGKTLQAESKLSYAVVAFTDYLRSSEEGVPRHYFAVIPTRFPADPNNKNALTLANLLEANGYGYDCQKKEITISGNGQKTILGLNQIEGEEFTSEVRRACGIYFFDQINGELIKNPVVPYPDEMPAVWDIEEVRDEEGNISLTLREQEEGNFKDFARARYDEERGEWRWEKVEVVPFLELSKAPEIEGLKAYLEENKIVYRAEATNSYELEEGDYAGEIVNYTLNQKGENGVGLVPPVLEVLLKEHQTLEALEERGEKFPLPFDPRGMEFEMEEISFPFVPKATGKERLINYLGLRLPLGTVIYCPVLGGEFGGSERMIFWYGYENWSFLTLEDEKKLGEECLNEGFCSIEKMPTGKEIVERVKEVGIRAEKTNKEEPWTYAPFFILFSQKSMAVNEGNAGWENIKEAFLGRELFTVDSEEPAQKYTAPTDYPILIKARQGLTTLDILYKIKSKESKELFVFIVSAPK